MLKSIRVFIIPTIISTFVFADVFMTELTDPQNSSDAGRYVELYNNGSEDVNLSTWSVQRWTNANADPTPSSVISLDSYVINAGEFFIICNDDAKFTATYGMDCHLNIGTGGFADSNGDDNMALLDGGVIVDMFGVAGEDGSGTGHEFEDGRAERAESNTAASATWDEAGWNIDNDSGGGDGNQYAPEGFDPGAWIGASTGGGDDCASGWYDCAGVCDGSSLEDECGVCNGDNSSCTDCLGNVNGDAVVDDCGVCNGGNSSCSANVCVHVDMALAMDSIGEGGMKARTSTVNGDYNPSDWIEMDQEGTVFSTCLPMIAGNTYGYNFNNSDGSGYESGDNLGDCAGGNYGNDRTYTPDNDAAGTEILLDAVCWESCDACPLVIEGCTDATATNYDADATVDDGTCEYDTFEAANLFISEAAEGSSNNKYFEVYNASDDTVDLSNYAYPTVSNAPSTPGEYEYWNTFADGATVAAGDVYVVCHGSADEFIAAECDETYTYLSNGDDGLCLVAGSDANYEILDCVGDWNGDPGSGWDVAGITAATKDHTLVRKIDVTTGNAGYWEFSAGTSDDDSEWIVFDQNTWDYLGSHPHDFSSDVPGCTDAEACNFNADATLDDGTCLYNDCAGECGGFATEDACGECNGDGSSCGSEPLFFSEAAEGSSNNKYLEIYNPTDATVSLSGYAFPSSSNGSDGNYEYWNSFAEGAEVAAGDVYVICHGSADDFIQAECDGYHTYLSNGDDGYCLVFGTADGFETLDCIGDWGADPGSGWDVAGVSAATKDHTIVRKSWIEMGNSGDWTISAGTNADDSEWVVLDQNDWTYLGSHPHDFTACDDIDQDGTCDDVDDCTEGNGYWDDCGVCGGENASMDECGVCDGSGIADGACDCDGNVLDCAGECNGLSTEDNCGICDFDPDNDCTQDCAGTWGGSAEVDECGECGGSNACHDCAGVPNGDSFLDCIGSCTDAYYMSWIGDGYCDDGSWGVNFMCVDFECDMDDCGLVASDDGTQCVPACAYDGDANADGMVNVTDIVLIVGGIIAGDTSDLLCSSDINQDGMVNVTDIVFLVGNIINGVASNNDISSSLATDAIVKISGNQLSVEGINGEISGIQLILTHGYDFEIILEDTEMANFEFSGVREINQNTTELFVVKDNLKRIGVTSGEYDITSIIAVTGKGESTQEISSTVIELPENFTLKPAYPNPFNPTTTLELAIPEAGYVSVKVYNLVGQEVATLVDGVMDATPSYTFQWNAGNLSSGVYLVRAEGAGQVTTQKLMLVK